MKLMQRTLRVNSDRFLGLYHLCYYFSADNHWDEDRKRVIAFKNQNELAIRQFVAAAIAKLIHHELNRKSIVMRAIGSDHLTIDYLDDTPLNRLGLSISAAFDTLYYPEIIY